MTRQKTASIAFGIFLLLSASSSSAKQLTGRQTNQYLDFAEIIPSFDVDLGAGLISTGDISLSLDPNNSSYLSFDFDTMEMTETLNLKASSPYLSSQGISYLLLKSEASGAITSPVPDLTDDGSFQPYSVASTMSGIAITNIGQPLDFSIDWNGQYVFSSYASVPMTRRARRGANFSPRASCSIKTGDIININTFNNFNSGGSSQGINVTSSGTGSSCVPIPGPLPLLGVGAALSISRKIKKSIAASSVSLTI